MTTPESLPQDFWRNLECLATLLDHDRYSRARFESTFANGRSGQLVHRETFIPQSVPGPSGKFSSVPCRPQAGILIPRRLTETGHFMCYQHVVRFCCSSILLDIFGHRMLVDARSDRQFPNKFLTRFSALSLARVRFSCCTDPPVNQEGRRCCLKYFWESLVLLPGYF